MSKRSNSRKLAMRVIYQFGVRNSELDDIFNDLETDSYANETIDWAKNIANLTEQHLKEIDTIIHKYSIDWDMERINHVDKALLRIGISEINYTDTPYQVVVNEIIELSVFQSDYVKQNKTLQKPSIIFMGNGSKLLSKYYNFDLKKKFTELIFFEENDSMICEAGLWYYLSDESILTNAKKKSKKVGFFESFFNIFSK